MRPIEVLKDQALGLAFMTAAALFPPVWRAMWRQERRAMQRPIWKKVSVTMAALLAAYGMQQYAERWRAEHPEASEGEAR